MKQGLSCDVSKSFSGVSSGFSLELSHHFPPGFTVFFGRSGAGKSLCLKLLSGLMKPDRGHIRLDGETFYDGQKNLFIPPQNRRIGYVFQKHSLFPHLSVRENIQFGGKGMTFPALQKKAEQFIELLDLSPLLTKFPRHLSGGEEQRVVLARALMNSPRVLLLDEPFSALDTPQRIRLRHLVKNLQKELSIPFILVTHDLWELMDLADHLVILKEGRIVQTGTPQDLVASAESFPLAEKKLMELFPKL